MITDYTDVKSLAAKVGCSSSWIRQQCQEGILTAKKLGGAWLIDKQAAKVWAKTLKIRPQGKK